MSKLQLSQIAGYLPYNLKIYDVENKETGTINMEFNLNRRNYIELDLVLGSPYVKPILRPLSDLTKEIEVEGKKFIPLVELLISLFEDEPINQEEWEISGNKIKLYQLDSFYYDNGTFRYTRNGKDGFINDQLELYQKMFEWHFDLFHLIEKGLAIDINTIRE